MTVTLPEPLGDRDVVWAPSRRWTQDATGALVRCELPQCDPAEEQRAPARCDNSSLRDTVSSGDVPRRFSIANVPRSGERQREGSPLIPRRSCCCDDDVRVPYALPTFCLCCV
jgi:hypothetical protein